MSPTLIKTTVKLVAALMLGGLVTALTGGVLLLNSKPDLGVWHTVKLDEEFTTRSPVDSFADYLQLEDRLFAQLDRLVVDRFDDRNAVLTNRFYRRSLSHPDRWPRNWNRSFEMPATRPVAGVLLLHGMSDSPYSLLSQAKSLHAAGATVLGLRLPGHGTAPSGLTTASWRDMAAAVRLAMRHLQAQVGDRPIAIVGYSNGGALAVHYALQALDDKTLPAPAHIVLLSPAIGVSSLAALAVWQGRIGRWLGLDKLEWNSIGPEYNPFKYNSFAVNAGDQTYRITAEIARLLDARTANGELGGFPPVLAFQSAVDATVSTPALITGLFDKLPANGHELVVYDVNRRTLIEYLLASDPRQSLEPLFAAASRPYTLRTITNRDPDSADLVLRSFNAGESVAQQIPLEVRWPADLLSLSHVALPFAPDDPLYGEEDGWEGDHIRIGAVTLRSERGLLLIPAADMLRPSWNPFHAWQQQRMHEFVGVTPQPQDKNPR